MALTSYLHKPLSINARSTCIEDLISLIKENNPETFDSIAFCGMGGALIVPSIADALGKSIILVRKSTDRCHSPFKVETVADKPKRYIVIDDYCETGLTFRYILNTLNEVFPESRCEYAIFYNGCELYESDLGVSILTLGD